MLRLCIKAENQKLHHSVIWLACFLIPIIPAIMGTFNYLQNTDILTYKWFSLWTQLSLFYSTFFYAPLIALYCSYLWRLEHMNHNWNVLMTVPVKDIFFGKLVIIFKVTLFTQLCLSILFVFCGKIIGFSGMPPIQILFWILRGTLAAIAIGTLQLLLSMCIRSFAIPIGIALLGSIIGMLISNIGKGLLWPYSLMLLGMNSNNYNDTLAGDTWKFIFSIIIFFTLFSFISITILKRKDIKA